MHEYKIVFYIDYSVLNIDRLDMNIGLLEACLIGIHAHPALAPLVQERREDVKHARVRLLKIGLKTNYLF